MTAITDQPGGCCCIARSSFAETPTSNLLVAGLMGDFDLPGMIENTGADHVDIELHPAYTLLPLLLLLYMMMTSIVLVNLLIAQMSSTYEAMSEVATDEWHYARAGLTLEYMKRTRLPPPLNLINHTYDNLHRLLCLIKLATRKPVGEGFTLYIPSAQQLELQNQERQAAAAVVRERNEENEEQNAAATSMAAMRKGLQTLETRQEQRFHALEQKIARVLDRLEPIPSPKAHRPAPVPAPGQLPRAGPLTPMSPR